MSEYSLVKGAYDSHFQFYSQAKQDRFIANLLRFKKNGSFVDIGSSGDSSNSYFFDQFLNWKGICVDLLVDNYANRKNTKCYNNDATTLNYKSIFKENELPSEIDYLSLDVDDASNSVLKILPFDEYKFSVITIEHDFYMVGERRRPEQIEILSKWGYHILCGNVSCTLNNGNVTGPFEDWWINPLLIDLESVKYLQCDKEHVDNIINKFS